MRISRCIAFMLLFAPVAWGADPNVALIHDKDPQMNAAIAKARSTLDGFFKTKSRREPGADGYTVKVLFREGSNAEHMWVTPFRPNGGGGYQGLLKSSPSYIKGLQWGQQVTFERDQITDWGYTQGNTLVGYFTVCVLLARDSALKARIEANGQRYQCAA
ncbi:DUF2314 domain-containing protein [Rubrivivax albus]|uniref:DUF2314 domain-containing protein n=2 Tax=Rubrivivax albus TaxID=2499835 RepID=A0A437JLC9_9BURK|nr:DUF2314 domain-containing protein [Rubrivivax albus]